MKETGDNKKTVGMTRSALYYEYNYMYARIVYTLILTILKK